MATVGRKAAVADATDGAAASLSDARSEVAPTAGGVSADAAWRGCVALDAATASWVLSEEHAASSTALARALRGHGRPLRATFAALVGISGGFPRIPARHRRRFISPV